MGAIWLAAEVVLSPYRSENTHDKIAKRLFNNIPESVKLIEYLDRLKGDGLSFGCFHADMHTKVG